MTRSELHRRCARGAGFVGASVIIACTFALSAMAQKSINVSSEQRASSRISTGEVFSRPVTVDLSRVGLRAAIKAIAKSADVHIQYRTELVDAETALVTMQATRMPLGKVLDKILTGTRLVPNAMDVDLVVLALKSSAVLDTIHGRVVDSATNEPIARATILLDDTVKGPRTGRAGTFHLPVLKPGKHRIAVRMLGYTQQVKTVTVRAGEPTSLTFALSHSVNALDQVVVTGTVAETQVRALPNAITVITAKQLEDRGITRIEQLFRGDVPGLFAQNIGTAPKSNSGVYVKRGAVRMFSRGASVLDSASPPIKTYLDGVELADPDYLNQIDPSSIERIEVISGPQASTIYGSGALGGVMQIFTKKGRLGQRRPEVVLNLKYGALQNNFSSALAPHHQDQLSLTDASGPYSYRVGASYDYDGQWTPGMYTRRYGVDGGLTRHSGPFEASLTGAYSRQNMGAGGGAQQARIADIENGLTVYNADLLIPEFGMVYNIAHTNLGGNMNYRPFGWWSHTLTIGMDRSSNGSQTNGARFVTPQDSLSVQYVYNSPLNSTYAYSTTMRGALAWFSSTITLGGNMSRSTSINRNATGNDINSLGSANFGYMSETRSQYARGGYFAQGMFSAANTVFLTTGVRAERNRAFGADRRTDVTPTWGLSLVRDLGPVTAKGRFTYGRATRPPTVDAADSVLACDKSPTSCAYYISNFGSGLLLQLANGQLRPESQSGPDGGVDFYFGQRGSISVTYYKQKVRDLLYLTTVGQVESTLNPSVKQNQTQWQNLGDIANTGWLGSGSLNVGPLGFTGSYSWTRSRVLRLNPTYTGTQIVGGSTLGMAEHTGALSVQYSSRMTTVNLAMTAAGKILQERNLADVVDVPRNATTGSLPNVSNPIMVRAIPGSRQMSLNASRTITQNFGLSLSVTNLTNMYRNEGDYNQALYPTLGRQTYFGARIKM